MPSEPPESTDVEARFSAWARRLAADAHRGREAREAAGTLRFVDEAARRRAAAAVQLGRTAALGREVSDGRNVRGDAGGLFQLRRFLQKGRFPDSAIGSDRAELDCHGFENTHVDALNHMSFEGTWYGGAAQGDRIPDDLSVMAFARQGIFTRAVHLDLGAGRDAGWVAADRPISGDELDAAVVASGTTVEPGDAVLLDMGRDQLERSGVHLTELRPRPGAGHEVAEWLVDKRVSIVCWDMLDAGGPHEPSGAVHRLLWAIGLVLIDNCRFDECRTMLAAAGRPTCALSVGPLAIAGGTGSLVNPLVVI